MDSWHKSRWRSAPGFDYERYNKWLGFLFIAALGYNDDHILSVIDEYERVWIWINDNWELIDKEK